MVSGAVGEYVIGIPSPPPQTQAARDTDGSRMRIQETTTVSRTRPVFKWAIRDLAVKLSLTVFSPI
jgi:hypothetical protein